MTTVDMTFDVDIEDVYQKLHWKDQEKFIRKHIRDLDDPASIVFGCLTEEEMAAIVKDNIGLISNEELKNEIFDRDIEIHNW